MKKISIVQLGFLKRQINLRKLKQWKSNLFSIDNVNEISYMPESDYSDDWQYLPDEKVSANVKHESNSDITIVVTEYRLEDNFYMRRVDRNVVAISLFEVGDILQNYHIPSEYFIFKNIYEIVTLLHIYHKLPTTKEEIPDIIHDETRGCLFDMHGIKTDIIYFFTGKHSLCSQCEAYLVKKQLPKDFLKDLVGELRKIRKPAFYKIYDFVKCHPIWSIAIVVISQLVIGLLAGLLANYLFLLKGLMTQH
jgi:hypothetical protein